MDSGEVTAVTSDLTLAEVLVKPMQDQNERLQDAYRQFLRPTSVLRMEPITREILEHAAGIRAAAELKLPDAIHLATAVSSRCDSFLTNDQAFDSVSFIGVQMLPNMVLS